ncbi:MAG TPA: hypothetical protein VIJ70_02470 [Gaiellaceae bacterium]
MPTHQFSAAEVADAISELAGVEETLRTLLAALPDLPPLPDDDLGVDPEDPDDEPDSIPRLPAWAVRHDDALGVENAA